MLLLINILVSCPLYLYIEWEFYNEFIINFFSNFKVVLSLNIKYFILFIFILIAFNKCLDHYFIIDIFMINYLSRIFLSVNY